MVAPAIAPEPLDEPAEPVAVEPVAGRARADRAAEPAEPAAAEPVPEQSESVPPDPHEPAAAEPVRPDQSESVPPVPHEPAAEAAAGSLEAPEAEGAVSGPVPAGPGPPARPTVRARPSRAADLPSLDDVLAWSTRGVATGRTWVVSPSAADLRARWDRLVAAPIEERAELFVVDERRDLDTVVDGALPARRRRVRPLAVERPQHADAHPLRPPQLRPPVDHPGPPGDRPAQRRLVVLAACTGPGVPDHGRRADRHRRPGPRGTSLLPQFNHFNGQRSRVWPLWLDGGATDANCVERLLPFLGQRYGTAVTGLGRLRLRRRHRRPSGATAPLRSRELAGLGPRPAHHGRTNLRSGRGLGHQVLAAHTFGAWTGDRRGPARAARRSRTAAPAGRPDPACRRGQADVDRLRPFDSDAVHRRWADRGRRRRSVGLPGVGHAASWTSGSRSG